MAKQENRTRVEKGLEPKFVKKRDLKEQALKSKFDSLEKSGRTERFMEK